MASELSRGAIALKSLRERAGLSQAQLAERSGVSVRSIGGIERGSIKSPHPSTLIALANALSLSPVQSDRFLNSWLELVRFRSYRELMSSEVHEGLVRALQEATFRAGLDKRAVSLSCHVTVGANRCIQEVRYDYVVEARRDGVDSHLFVCRRDNGDVRLTRVDQTVGCTVRSRRVDASANLVAVDLALGRVLGEGELFSFGFRQVNGWPTSGGTSSSGISSGTDTRFGSSPRGPIDVLSLRISFTAGALPTSVHQVGDHGPVGLEIDSSATVSAVWQSADAGTYLIEWSWD